MIDGPIGAAAFNNEFGRPNILGYFRTFELRVPGDAPGRIRGYHKPIMIAGGLGNIRRAHVEKREIPVGARLVVLGGPAMLIGLGGGAASSLTSGASQEDLDFASVQRGNPEIQRRAQEVIDRCWALGERNPILLIHDVGAGGLSNAVPEAIAHSQRGGRIDFRSIPTAEPGMSPLEVWCNEAQERYVLAVAADGRADARSALRARALPVRRDRRDHRRWAPDARGPRTSTTARSICQSSAARQAAARCCATCKQRPAGARSVRSCGDRRCARQCRGCWRCRPSPTRLS